MRMQKNIFKITGSQKKFQNNVKKEEKKCRMSKKNRKNHGWKKSQKIQKTKNKIFKTIYRKQKKMLEMFR